MAMLIGNEMGATEGLRGYIKTLRDLRDKTQEETADLVGISRRTYQDWERGVIDTIKGSVLLRIIKALDGSFAALEHLVDDDTTFEDGKDIALKYNGPNSIHDRIEHIVATTDPEELADIIDDLRQEYSQRPIIIQRLRDWLSGLRSKL